MRLRKFLLAGHVRVDRRVIGLRDGIAVVIGPRLLHRLAADDMRDRIDADIAADLLGAFADVGDMAAGIGDLGEGREEIVALGGGKVASRSAEGRVHGHRARRLQAGRAADRVLQRVVGAVMVEGLVRGVEPLDDLQPLGGLVVALLDQRHAEHAELLRIPAADDVEARAALADVIDGGQRLGRVERMHQRHMHGHEQADLLGRSAPVRPPR